MLTRGPGGAGSFAGFRTRWALLISLAGGLALYASFPPVDAWPLAVAGPGLLVVALTGRSLRASFGCGLAFGLALFVPLLSWLVNEAWYAWAALAGARGGHLRGARRRAAAAAEPAVLARRGGGLVGPGRGDQGPVAVRLPLGPAGDEPVRRPRRPLGRDRRRAAAQLPGRPRRRDARPARCSALLADRSSWRSPRGPVAGRGGDGGAGAGGRAAAGRSGGGCADGSGGRDPGERAAGQEPAAAAERHPGHAEPRRGHAEAGRAGQGGPAARAWTW